MDKKIWDKATEDPNFVSLQTDKEKKLKLVNWRFDQRNPEATIAPGEYEFKADVLEEDDEKVPVGEQGPKQLTTTSNRLKKKLRPILEERDPAEPVVLFITKVGEQFATQYLVTEEKTPKEEKAREQ